MVAVVAIFSFFRATPFFLWGKKSPSCVLETNFCRHNRERERERECEASSVSTRGRCIDDDDDDDDDGFGALDDDSLRCATRSRGSRR